MLGEGPTIIQRKPEQKNNTLLAMLAKEELRKKLQAEPGLGRGIHLPQPVGGKGSETGIKDTLWK